MADEQIEKIEDELERTRQDLSQALEEVNRKVEEEFDVRSLVRDRPLTAIGCAGAIGFLTGLNANLTPLVAMLLGAALGVSIGRRGEQS